MVVSSCPSGELAEPELWLVDLAAAGEALAAVESATPRLSPDDERKIAAIKDAAVGSERRAAHIALRVLLERAFGPGSRRAPYEVSATGKPGLSSAGGAFSLSHVPGLALIGLAPSGTIGVDVERVRPLRISGARHERIEGAAVVLARGAPLPDAPEVRLLQAWVRIEAAAKADGCGVGPLLTRLGAGHAPPEAAAPPPFAIYDLALGEGLIAAAAVPEGSSLPAPRAFPLDAARIERLASRQDC